MNGQRVAVGRRVGAALLVLATTGWAAAALAQPADGAKQPIESVLREGIGTAKIQIEQTFSFDPFAVVEHSDGRLETLAGQSGGKWLEPIDSPELQADPKLALEQLRRRVKRLAEEKGDLAAVGIFIDDDVKLPDGSDSDAIHAELEQVSGSCVDVFVPYGRSGENVEYGDEIREKGDGGLVFRCR